MTCDAHIRPLPDLTIEIDCDKGDGWHVQHQGQIRDYAYPGSSTTIGWFEDDRRNYHGDWPGQCALAECTLPAGHRGNHAP